MQQFITALLDARDSFEHALKKHRIIFRPRRETRLQFRIVAREAFADAAQGVVIQAGRRRGIQSLCERLDLRWRRLREFPPGRWALPRRRSKPYCGGRRSAAPSLSARMSAHVSARPVAAPSPFPRPEAPVLPPLAGRRRQPCRCLARGIARRGPRCLVDADPFGLECPGDPCPGCGRRPRIGRRPAHGRPCGDGRGRWDRRHGGRRDDRQASTNRTPVLGAGRGTSRRAHAVDARTTLNGLTLT